MATWPHCGGEIDCAQLMARIQMRQQEEQLQRKGFRDRQDWMGDKDRHGRGPRNRAAWEAARKRKYREQANA